MWAQGDYTAVAVLLEPCAVTLADRCGIRVGMRVLDVAAGNGNFALAAVQRGADVTACDMTPRMIELGRARTHGHSIEWVEGDAEDLPFPDASFDVVASVFGVMFAPRPERVAHELFRVCRAGGQVAMANYSREGFLGAMSDLFARYSTPLQMDLPSPFEWGDPQSVHFRLGSYASQVDVEPGTITMRFQSVDAGLEFWERTNAPTIALKVSLPPERYEEFRRDARRVMNDLNAARAQGLMLNSSFLSVLAAKSA